MNTTAAEQAAEAALERNPRQAPWGFYSGGSFVIDSSRVFSWFESLSDLGEFLENGLLEIHGIEGEELKRYQAQLDPLVRQLKADGPNAELLAQVNAVVKDEISIDWWGNFSELIANETGFSRRIASGFLDEDEAGRALFADELDDFFEYLQTCGC